MRGKVILEVLAKKDQNYVNGTCDFCGDRFASHILILRHQQFDMMNYNEYEHKFCDECFKELRNAVSKDLIATQDND